MKALAMLLALATASGGTAPDMGVAPPFLRAEADPIRVWGTPAAQAVVDAWSQRFRASHPHLKVVASLAGSDIGMAGLYTAQADVVVLGRPATESELKAFEWVFRKPPMTFQVMTGSLDIAGQSPAVAILVHRDNPMRSISVTQLAGVFGQRNDSTDLRLWSQLGVEGHLAAAPINLYGPAAESGTGRYFRERVLEGSNRMNWSALIEFEEAVRSGHVDDSASLIAAALAADPAGMALGVLPAKQAGIKAVAVKDDSGPALLPDRETVRSRQYPFSRPVYVYVNANEVAGMDRDVRAFLGTVLGSEGQSVVERMGGYLPLDHVVRRAQQEKLASLPIVSPRMPSGKQP